MAEQEYVEVPLQCCECDYCSPRKEAPESSVGLCSYKEVSKPEDAWICKTQHCKHSRTKRVPRKQRNSKQESELVYTIISDK